MANKVHTAIAKQEDTPRKKRALRVWLGLLTSTLLIEKRVRARFRTEFDTTLPRFDVMAALAREPKGQTMGDVSRWLLVSSGNVTGIISRLVADGLVTRTRSVDDRRTHLVRLSRKGQGRIELGAKTSPHPFFDQIRHEAGVATMAVGNIYETDHLNSIIAAGRADLCCLARPHLADPYWTLHAAAQLGYGGQGWPIQYDAGGDQYARNLARAAEMVINA